MDKSLYPIERNLFDSLIQPTIEKSCIWKGRPPKISHYEVFCAILYVLGTGIPWKDLPKCFGNGHTIYTRFYRGNEKSLCWKILLDLQQQKKFKMNVVLSFTVTAAA